MKVPSNVGIEYSLCSSCKNYDTEMCLDCTTLHSIITDEQKKTKELFYHNCYEYNGTPEISQIKEETT